jgi:hypothetical protein
VVERVPSPVEHLERACALVADKQAVPVVVAAPPRLLAPGLAGGFVSRTDEVRLIFRRAG